MSQTYPTPVTINRTRLLFAAVMFGPLALLAGCVEPPHTFTTQQTTTQGVVPVMTPVTAVTTTTTEQNAQGVAVGQSSSTTRTLQPALAPSTSVTTTQTVQPVTSITTTRTVP